MNEQPAMSARRGRLRLGCLTRILLAIAAAVAIVVVIGETFDQGDKAKQPLRELDAGPAEEYAKSNVTAYETHHLYVVRLADGTFHALYDQSSRQQELGSDCRLHFDEDAQLIGLPQLEGFRGAFVEDCSGSPATWRADGKFAGGASFGDLDRFDTHIDDDGHLIVKLTLRTCTRSSGSGVPPYHTTTCRNSTS
jgi:hypothetical protein